MDAERELHARGHESLRGEAVRSPRAASKLITAAGGELISFYRTLTEGPGVIVIFDADPIAAAAVNAVVVAGGAVMDVKIRRLWSDEDVTAIRKKRAEIEGAYSPPG